MNLFSLGLIPKRVYYVYVNTAKEKKKTLKSKSFLFQAF